jgi:hypothetical protein
MLRKYGTEKKALLDILERNKEARAAGIAEENTKRSSIDELTRKISDVNRKIEGLEIERGEFESQYKSIIHELTELERSNRRAGPEYKKAESGINNIERSIRDAIDEKNRFRSRLEHATISAFKKFLESVEIQLSQFLLIDKDIQGRKRSFERFEIARHSDPTVMSQYEEWLEFSKLIKNTHIARIKDQLEILLGPIESKLDNAFPGVLSILKGTISDNTIDEVFELYYTGAEKKFSKLFLPISIPTWNEIEEGKQSPSALAALRLVWGLARNFGNSLRGAYLRLEGDMVFLNIESALLRIESPVEVKFTIANIQEATIQIQRAPHEVELVLDQYVK